MADAAAAAERACASGGSLVAGPLEIPAVGRIAVLRDASRARISAYQPRAALQPPQGMFAWDELQSGDLAAAADFYGAVFGWQSRTVEMGSRGAYTVFSVGGRDVAGCAAPLAGGPPQWLTYLATADVDGATDRARELGATVEVGPTSIAGVGRFSLLSDPAGAAFGLYRAEALAG